MPRLFSSFSLHQGCQTIYLQTKSPNLGIFWYIGIWERKMFVYFTADGYIFEGLGTENVCTYIYRPFGLFYGNLVYFGTLYQEKSGNSALHTNTKTTYTYVHEQSTFLQLWKQNFLSKKKNSFHQCLPTEMCCIN
jgi:hypothetical protein